jgi:hypothetical protein
MPTTEDSIKVSHDRFSEQQAERRWEICTGAYGPDHRPEADLEDAVKAHLARFQHPDGAPIPAGTVVEWKDGQAIGKPRPLHVELASLKEIADKSKAVAGG